MKKKLDELRATQISSPLKDTDPKTGNPIDCVRWERDPETGEDVKMPCKPKKGYPSFKEFHINTIKKSTPNFLKKRNLWRGPKPTQT